MTIDENDDGRSASYGMVLEGGIFFQFALIVTVS
jgi:hypothetical protein